jgi:serine/threonine protein kinase/Flp pilus assembly protein TadD
MGNWDQIESIINSVLMLPPEAREKYVEDQCGEDIELKTEVIDYLSCIENSNDFFNEISLTQDAILTQLIREKNESDSDSSLLGTTIGKYRIIELISHGGMGTVFLAERCDGVFKRKVALKLIRHGMDTPENISRFERERSILAGLNHPSIAGLIDGGVAKNGLPYLVMEYIDGMPLDEYCDHNHLTVRQRIELVKTVCDAVQYAHNNMIIHRDLKPANILVDCNGNVKILDFGIAKLLEEGLMNEPEVTQTTRNLMTPNYASPEQMLGQTITTATDTYSLGVILYKLLSGCSPFNLQNTSIVEQQQIISHKTPSIPSKCFSAMEPEKKEELSKLRSTTPVKLFNDLKSDVDAIISKALRKDADARYKTADALSEDLTRFLSNLPVLAHQGTFRYKSKKLVLRNYKMISAAAAVLLAVTTFSLYHTKSITAERNQAQTEAAKTSQITALLFELFQASEPGEALGDTITAQELLQRALLRADLLNEQPILQAQMYSVIGRVYYQLGNFRDAFPLLEESVNIYTKEYGPDHIETATTMAGLGALLGAKGDFNSAEILLNKALSICNKNSSTDVSMLASIKSDLGYILRRQGDFVEAEKLFRSSSELLYKHFGPNHIQTANVRNSLGSILFNKGKYEEAEAIYRSVLATRFELLGNSHPDIAQSKSSLGALLMNLGNFDEAENLFLDAYRIRYKSLGKTHPNTLLTLNNLAILKRDRGLLDESESLFEEVLAYRLQTLGETHASTAMTWFSMGELQLMKNNPAEARILLEKALPVFEHAFSSSHSFYLRTKMAIGQTYLAENNIEAAEELILEGYERVKNIHGIKSLEHALADHQVGLLHMSLGNYTIADSIFTKANETLGEIEKTKSIRQLIVQNDHERLRRDLVAGTLQKPANN